MNNTWFDDETIDLLEIVSEEYTPAQKKQMGIPPNAEARGGKWFVGNEYAGKVVKGRFVPVPKSISRVHDLFKKQSKPKTSTTSSTPQEEPNTFGSAIKKLTKARKALQKLSQSVGDDLPSDWIDISVKDVLKLTGMSKKEFDLVQQHSKGGIWVRSGLVQIRPDFWSSIGPRRRSKPLKLDGVETRQPVDLDAHSETFPEKRAREEAQAPSKIKLDDQTKREIKEHSRIIRDDENVDNAVGIWTRDSIWREPPSTRQATFRQINKAIDEHDMRIKTKQPLYRGLHFEKKTTKFAKQLLTEFTSGKVVKLPPAGFAVDIGYAIDFANVGDLAISVIMVLLPKKGGLRGMHASGRSWAKQEREVITREAQYKVVNSVLQQFDNAGYQGSNQTAIHLTITIEQTDKLNEDNIGEVSNSVIDFLFGDKMEHTADNLKKLSA